MQSETGDAYTGGAYVTTSGRICRPWSSSNSFNCQGFADRNTSAVGNKCRNPGHPERCYRERPWCYHNYGQWEYCYVPLCDHVREGCVSAIGLHSRDIIFDDQFSASSSASSQYAPSAARINSDAGFWMPANNDRRPYLQVDLRSLYRVTGLRVQGSSRYRYAYAVMVLYSNDGWTWTAYSDNKNNDPREFEANHSPGTDITHINFAKPFTARQIAIVPKYRYSPALKIELYGCEVSNASATFTNVTDDIERNTFWGLSNSPYVIQRRLTVSHGATLSIAPGVNVVFDGSNSGLTVAGCIDMGGVTGLEVQMTSSSPLSLVYRTRSSGSSYWKGISILYNLHTDCGSSAISNVKIRNAEAALSFVVGDVCLQNVEIASSLNALTLPSKASLQLIGCKFYDNKFAVNANDAGHVNISSSTFERNENAVLLRNRFQLVVDDSRFSGNTQGLSVSTSSSYVAVFIRRSRFDDDTVQITANYRNANLSFEGCSFNSSRLTVHVYQPRRTSSVSVANSTFQSSSVRLTTYSSSQMINISIIGCSFRQLVYRPVIELYAWLLRNVTVAGNVFEQNRRATCIKVRATSSSGRLAPGVISIVKNSFINQSDANVIVIDDQNYHRTQLRRNVFQNPLCQFEIELQSPWRSGYAVDAGENWWGSMNRTYVAERVSDFFLDLQKAKVNITSIYSDPEMRQLEQFPELRTWCVTDGNLAGGELDRNVTLSSSNISYFVNKTIYIPRPYQLQLEGNVMLHFAERRGIIIEGRLI